MQLRPAAGTFAGATALAAVVAGLLASAPASATAPRAAHHPVPHAPAAAALLARSGGPRAAAIAAAGAGTLTGTLSGAAGRPISGACVIASGRFGSSMAMTRPDGRYVLPGLPAGRYALHVTQCAAPARFFGPGGAPWSGAPRQATVRAGQLTAIASGTLASGPRPVTPAITVRSGLPAGLQVGASVATGATGAISGVVTGNGKPLKGICVFTYGPTFRSAKTMKNGHYRLGHLRAGRYFVRFVAQPFCGPKNGNWLSQWYKGITGFFIRKRPTVVHVHTGQTTTGIDAALKLGGEIRGTVRSKAGRALAHICVQAIFTGKSKVPFFFGGFTRSGIDGRYALHALFPGTYKVEFTLGCGNRGNFALQWWRNASTKAQATPIKITSGRVVSKVDAAMPRGASVSGVVRAGGPTGKRLHGVCVFANPRNNQQFAFTRTARDGSYKLVGLTTGGYTLDFERCGSRANVLSLHEFVRVRTGQTITGFDAFLPLGAIVRGTVTNTHGAPVGGVCVQVQGPGFGGGRTKADGSYSINAMPEGSYTVQFVPGCGNTGSYAPQFYKGQTNPAAADQVPLIEGQATAGIDAALRPGGTITGLVTDSSGNKLSNVCVDVTSMSQAVFPFYYSNIACTTNGAYTVANLAPGLYQVDIGVFSFSKANRGLADQWFMSKLSSGSADLVSAPGGVITSGISAALSQAGTISGTVTNHFGKPLANICVLAIPAGSPYPTFFFGRGTGYTGRKGGYTIRGLAPGSYDLQFRDCGGTRYGSQWFGGKPTQQTAVPVIVHSGAATTGINATMRFGGSISGQVTDSAGHPLRNICVQAEDLTTESFGFSYTGRTNSYTLKGLSSGTYQLLFFDCGYPQHFGSVTRSVTVTAPNAVTGINQRLTPAGSLAGTVTGAASGRPQANVCVAVVPVSGNASFGEGVTDDTGSYTVTGLSAGSYLVYFGDQFCGFARGFGPFFFFGTETDFAPQWFNGQPTQSTATKVTVTAGTLTSGIGASLAIDGGISGTATNASHTPVAGECVTAAPVNPVPDPLFGRTLNHVIAVTAADGTYSLVDLPPGHYKVEFSASCGATGFKTQWWKNAASQATATTITVSAAAVTSGIDATLQH